MPFHVKHGGSVDIGCTLEPKRYGRYWPNLGTPQFARVFAPPGAGLPSLGGPAVAGLPLGCPPWISHKDAVPLDQVATWWRVLINRYPNRPLRWTYYHEAAGDGAPNRADYIAYWRDLVDAADSYPQIQLVQIQTNYAMRWRTDTDWRQWLLSGVALGFDCYPLSHFRYEPPESMFGLLSDAADDLGGVPWGVPELGADIRPGQDRLAWLAECVDYLHERGASFVGLWAAGSPYEPSDPATLAGYSKLVKL